MGTFQRLLALLEVAVSHTGPAAPAVLFGASLVEYVFPLFPGDSVVVLGAWYAVRGALSWPLAFAAVTAGASAGAWLDWRVGVALRTAVAQGAARRGPLDAERLARFGAAYRRWGSGLLLANRFLPGVRAFIFVAAGASGLPAGRVVALGTVSAAAWNALLLAAGALLARSAADLALLLDRYARAAWIALALAAAGLAARALLRRRPEAPRA